MRAVSLGSALQQPAAQVVAAGERGWRALACVWRGRAAAARDRTLSARWTVHGSPNAVVALADSSEGRTASPVSPVPVWWSVTRACI